MMESKKSRLLPQVSLSAGSPDDDDDDDVYEDDDDDDDDGDDGEQEVKVALSSLPFSRFS